MIGDGTVSPLSASCSLLALLDKMLRRSGYDKKRNEIRFGDTINMASRISFVSILIYRQLNFLSPSLISPPPFALFLSLYLVLCVLVLYSSYLPPLPLLPSIVIVSYLLFLFLHPHLFFFIPYTSLSVFLSFILPLFLPIFPSFPP